MSGRLRRALSLQAGALIVFVYFMAGAPALGRGLPASAPLDTSPTSPTAAPAAASVDGAQSCDGQRSELRTRATRILGIPEDTDLRAPESFRTLISKHCDLSVNAPANRSSSRHGYCERTYVNILFLIRNSDKLAAEACAMSKEGEKKAASCREGQNECFTAVEKLYAEGSQKFRSAQQAMKKGGEMLDHQILRHRQVARSYAEHLRVIAKAIEDNDNSQRALRAAAPAFFVAQTAMQRRQAISEEVRNRLNQSVKNTEGKEDLEEMLRLSGLDMNPRRIRARAAEIDSSSQVTGPVGNEVNFEAAYGGFAGEQLGAMDDAYSVKALVAQADQRLGAGAQQLDLAAQQVRQSLGRSGTIQPENSPPSPARPGSPQPATQPVQVDPVPQRVASSLPAGGSTGASLPMAFTTGASVASAMRQISPATAPSPASGPVPQAAAASFPAATPFAPARSGRRLALSPGEAEILAGDMGRTLSEREKQQDEMRVSAGAEPELSSGLESPRVMARAPSSPVRIQAAAVSLPAESAPQLEGSQGGILAASRAPASSLIPRESASSEPSANALAYADRQLARMEQGRRFSPSLRDQLRRRMASEYAKSKGNARAAADLFEEMRRADEVAVAGAVTGEGDEQMAILDSQGDSLFVRVHSAYRRLLR
jgi:hypothetical protein